MVPEQVTDPGGRELGWISVLVAALFVITVSGVFAWLMRDQLVERDDASDDTSNELLSDDFGENGENGELGGEGDGNPWIAISGEWATDAGKAVVAASDGVHAVAVLDDLPATATIEATIGVAAKCGVVGRFRSATDHVALYRVPEFGVWNLVVVTEDGSEFLGNLPDSPTMDVSARLTIGTRVVEAHVLGRSLTVALDEVAADSRVGLIGIDDIAGCSWDDVVVESVP